MEEESIVNQGLGFLRFLNVLLLQRKHHMDTLARSQKWRLMRLNCGQPWKEGILCQTSVPTHKTFSIRQYQSVRRQDRRPRFLTRVGSKLCQTWVAALHKSGVSVDIFLDWRGLRWCAAGCLIYTKVHLKLTEMDMAFRMKSQVKLANTRLKCCLSFETTL